MPLDARILEIVDLSRLKLEAAVWPSRISPRWPWARQAPVQVDGLAAPVAARVARINPSTSAGARTVAVYLSVDSHPALRQGLFARGSVEAGRQAALSLLPKVPCAWTSPGLMCLPWRPGGPCSAM